MGRNCFACAFLCALFAVGFGVPAEYDLQQHCNSTISTFSSILLKVDGLWWVSTKECTIRIHATHSYDSQVRLEVLDLKTPCQSLGVTLQDGPDSQDNNIRPTTRPMSPVLCDDGRKMDTMYLTTSDTLTLTITLNSTAPLDPGANLTVRLIATSNSIAYQTGDFECDNMFNVEHVLACDGYNNCGDLSDESHHLCHHHHHWKLHVGIIAGSSAVGVIIIVIVIVMIRRKRRHQNMSRNRTVPEQRTSKDGLPPYGSLQ